MGDGELLHGAKSESIQEQCSSTTKRQSGIDGLGGEGGFGEQEKSEKADGDKKRHDVRAEGRPTALCVGFSEIDRYAIQIYKKRFSNHKNYGDATKIKAEDLPDFDMLCAGFPCQSFSIAGKRKGFQDTRGTLFYEICRIAQAKRPRLLFLENVKGLLSHDRGRTFAAILVSLDELGYDVEWQVLNSKDFGVPQNRERVFIVGHLRTEPSKEVFPLGQTRTEGTGAHQGKREGEDRNRIVKVASMFGREHQAGSVYSQDGISPTLDDCQGGYREPMVMVNLHQWRTGEYGDGVKEEESFTLDQGSGRDYCVTSNAIGSDGVGDSLDGHSYDVIKSRNKIRRLTPVECERLQGFYDNWTKEGIDENGNTVQISDTQRYKVLGNAVTVNVIESIMARLIEVIG